MTIHRWCLARGVECFTCHVMQTCPFAAPAVEGDDPYRDDSWEERNCDHCGKPSKQANAASSSSGRSTTSRKTTRRASGAAGGLPPRGPDQAHPPGRRRP